ncbi:hypothetical protein SAMN05421753_10362 [Planctomicrobium piriforme]|uniref:Uncharacterized protein n=2 Tax=Planctomicrobium piriforme TaxID=1576369 RepID=A0A1I3D289_9PLAN|nr:hypothetical protein SAMN05421753_10362 [Planctomicrobium piriforme]
MLCLVLVTGALLVPSPRLCEVVVNDVTGETCTETLSDPALVVRRQDSIMQRPTVAHRLAKRPVRQGLNGHAFELPMPPTLGHMQPGHRWRNGLQAPLLT